MVRFSFQILKNQVTPNIVCSFDNNKYIFNPPDGFQRFTKDNYVKINPGPRIFFTRLSTQTTTGCFGYLSTLLPQNCDIDTKIYGPKGLCKLIIMKRFNEIGGFKSLPYSIQEFNGKCLLGIKDIKLIEELMQPETIPQAAIILDIANLEQMQKLICHMEFNKTLQQFNSKQINLVDIFHLSHQIQEDYYFDFIKKYSNINHIFCNYFKQSNDKICQTHLKIQPLSELLSNLLHYHFPFNFPQMECLILKPISNDLKNLNQMLGYVSFLNIQFFQLNNKVINRFKIFHQKTLKTNQIFYCQYLTPENCNVEFTQDVIKGLKYKQKGKILQTKI